MTIGGVPYDWIDVAFAIATFIASVFLVREAMRRIR